MIFNDRILMKIDAMIPLIKLNRDTGIVSKQKINSKKNACPVSGPALIRIG